jgi:hypothetical protein
MLREQKNRTRPSLPVAKMKEEGEGISKKQQGIVCKTFQERLNME